jgi:PAS domain-containing protein
MLGALKHLERYKPWQLVWFAGLAGFGLALGAASAVAAAFTPLGPLVIALVSVIGLLSGVCLAGAVSGWSARRSLSEQNARLDGAITNMVQGLCMFDAQNRLLVWNERYRAMYNIEPHRIWRGCTIRDLLDARIARHLSARSRPL